MIRMALLTLTICTVVAVTSSAVVAARRATHKRSFHH